MIEGKTMRPIPDIINELSVYDLELKARLQDTLKHPWLVGIQERIKSYSTSDSNSDSSKNTILNGLYKYSHDILFPILNPTRNISNVGTKNAVGKWFGSLHRINIIYYENMQQMLQSLQKEHIDLMPEKKRRIGRELFNIIEKIRKAKFQKKFNVNIPVTIINCDTLNYNGRMLYFFNDNRKETLSEIIIAIEYPFGVNMNLQVHMIKQIPNGTFRYTESVDHWKIQSGEIINNTAFMFNPRISTIGKSSIETVEPIKQVIEGYVDDCFKELDGIQKDIHDFKHRYAGLILDKGLI